MGVGLYMIVESLTQGDEMEVYKGDTIQLRQCYLI